MESTLVYISGINRFMKSMIERGAESGMAQNFKQVGIARYLSCCCLQWYLTCDQCHSCLLFDTSPEHSVSAYQTNICRFLQCRLHGKLMWLGAPRSVCGAAGQGGGSR